PSAAADRAKVARGTRVTHSPCVRRVLLLCPVLAVACGGNLMDEPIEAPTASTAPTTRVAKPSPPPGSLFRKDVNTTVEEGLGYFLQRVSVDPDVVDGKFRGFRIVDLR